MKHAGAHVRNFCCNLSDLAYLKPKTFTFPSFPSKVRQLPEAGNDDLLPSDSVLEVIGSRRHRRRRRRCRRRRYYNYPLIWWISGSNSIQLRFFFKNSKADGKDIKIFKPLP